MRLAPVNLALDLAGSFKEKPVDAYERLIMDVVKGNLTLFHAPGRAGCGVALDRSDPRGLGAARRADQVVRGRQLGHRQPRAR